MSSSVPRAGDTVTLIRAARSVAFTRAASTPRTVNDTMPPRTTPRSRTVTPGTAASRARSVSPRSCTRAQMRSSPSACAYSIAAPKPRRAPTLDSQTSKRLASGRIT